MQSDILFGQRQPLRLKLNPIINAIARTIDGPIGVTIDIHDLNAIAAARTIDGPIGAMIDIHDFNAIAAARTIDGPIAMAMIIEVGIADC